jgi:hypothetical protein
LSGERHGRADGDEGDEVYANVDLDRIPDARDGLTRVERVVLTVLLETQAERRGRNVPMPMLYGRVLERVDLSQAELMAIVQRWMGRRAPT